MIIMGLLITLSSAQSSQRVASTSEVISMTVHTDQPTGTLKSIWSFFGYDEANYTFGPDGQELLAKIAQLYPNQAYIRAHHLLTSGTGETWLKWSSTNVYTEDAQGNPVYDWTILDRIFDTFHGLALKPYVEIGFMPQALTVHPEDYTPEKVLHGKPRGAVSGGAFYPPKDYTKWEALMDAWIKHCLERYGREEVSRWFWDLWNEPNIRYWKGTLEEYLILYDHTVAALRRVLPSARVGGPHVTNPTGKGSEEFLRAFIKHCLSGTNHVTGKTGTPVDFIGFHAKGGTQIVNGRVRMNAANHLRTIDRGCAIVASFPELKGIPVIVGESDPDGCAACSSEFYPQNAYRNGAQFSSYTAATFMRKQDVAARHGVNLEGALTWAFAFENQPWFAGFRTLSTRGVVKPVFNTFRIFSLLEKQRVRLVNSAGRSLENLMKPESRAIIDIDGVATRGDRTLSVILWHHHDDDTAGPARNIELNVQGLPSKTRDVKLLHYRIDEHHSNAYIVWQEMGSPQNPTQQQVNALKKAAELTLLEPCRTMKIKGGSLSLKIPLPRHAVSLIRLEWQ
jgi:xylan 1,4-beta-xylosidase